MSENKERFISKRTIIWILVLIICLIVEFLIIDYVYEFGDNENLVSYISLAGTISSILLAFLAIIYAFYQSYSQSVSGSEIKNQIFRLREIVTKIDASENSFSQELDRIDEVSDKLDESLALLNESKSTVTKIHERVNNLSPNQSIDINDNGSEKNPKPASSNLNLDRLARRSNSLVQLMNSALLRAEGERYFENSNKSYLEISLKYSEMLDLILFDKLSKDIKAKLLMRRDYYYAVFEVYKNIRLYWLIMGTFRMNKDFMAEVEEFEKSLGLNGKTLNQVAKELIIKDFQNQNG